MFDLKFLYPEGGYIFYKNEKKCLMVCLSNPGSAAADVELLVHIETYRRCTCYESRTVRTLQPGAEETVEFHPELTGLGYFKACVTARCGGGEVCREIGLGVTTPHQRSGFPQSLFGVSANAWTPAQHIPMFAKLGVSYLRNPGKTAAVENRELLKKHGMRSTVQIQGRHILTGDRFAPDIWNAAYHYEKQMGDVVAITEHGNEHSEERNLMLFAEWHKSSGLARLKANPAGWYSNSGEAGVDLPKIKVMHELGMLDYITCLSVHAYTFPMAPEQPYGYWSTARLAGLGEWMQQNDVRLPVVCMEQGYPAMNGQTRCESYSPGDLVSLDGQVDYLVRSWLVYASLGVSKVVWYNGPFLDGFAFMDKEGPAPWPAMMALAQLIRMIDHADYVGNYERDEGVWFPVFRDRRTGRLLGAVWKPVYLARSCEKEKNLTPDGRFSEADGAAQECFDYSLHHLLADTRVLDVMGNPVPEDGTISIGERPVYIDGLAEEIVPLLHDRRVFRVRTVEPHPLPPSVILGLTDKKPAEKGEFLTSVFRPGETREYEVRVHNYSDEPLEDTLVLEAPAPFTLDRTEIPVRAAAGTTARAAVQVACDPLAGECVYKINARLAFGCAHPVYQLAGVTWPLAVEPLRAPLEPGGEIKLSVQNHGDRAQTYTLHVSHEHIRFRDSVYTVTAEAGACACVSLAVESVSAPFEPLLNVEAECGGTSAVYVLEIPLHYMDYVPEAAPALLESAQRHLISHPRSLFMARDDYSGPSLIGNACPAPLLSYGRMLLDERYVYLRADVYDDTVVCIKNTRRNNIDSDGIWLRFYRAMEDTKPERHFCIMPADAAGRPEGCSVNEVREGILFASPYTDYDYNGIQITSRIYEDHYSLDVRIARDSIALDPRADTVALDVRVLDMNHNDWTRMYDTGKIAYSIVRV